MALQKQHVEPGNLIPEVDTTNEPDALMARASAQEDQAVYQN